MRFTRLATLALGLAALTACEDEVTSPDTPPLGGVRYINAVADTFAVDITMIDQLEWSANARNLNFRAGTEHFPTEVGERRVRVFAFNSANPNIGGVTTILLDTTLTVTVDQRSTFLLTGSARAGNLRFVEIVDNPPEAAAGQISVRAINTSTGAVDVYYVPRDTSTITGAPAIDNLAAMAVSPYQGRATGAVAARVTPDNSTTVAASQAGPAAPSTLPGATPAPGVDVAGSGFSVYYFPRGVAGSPQNSRSTPAVVWFVDKQAIPAGQ